MKLITLEEHFSIAAVPGINVTKGEPPLVKNTMVNAPWLLDPDTAIDIDSKRIAYMDADDVAIQVISTPFAQSFEADIAVDYCKKINDFLASKIAVHSDRFAGFAAIPTAVPSACAAELERCVNELGFVGALIGGRVGDGTGFLCAPEYDEFLSKAEELEVPIYLHPGVPPQPVVDLCYSNGFSENIISTFKRYGYGWHVDPGIHMLNMILNGTFDKYPKLQMILGHWGELLPYFIDRFDDAMPKDLIGTKHNPSYYLCNNMYVTPSGIFTTECLDFCVKRIGINRILFSIDYPFASSKGKEKILKAPFLSHEDVEKIAYLNAKKLLKLQI